MAFTAKKSKKKDVADRKKLKDEKREKKARQNPKETTKKSSNKTRGGLLDNQAPTTLQTLIENTPKWWLDLFNYVHLFEELDIDVTKEATDSTNPKDKRFKAKYLERQLFLIFECLPKVRPEFEDKLTQRDFAQQAALSENILGTWKREEWFWGNRVRLMKRIFSLHTPDVIEALYRGSTAANFITGQYDAKCIKLWLEYVEGFIPGIDLSSKGESLVIQFASGPSKFIQAPTEDENVSPQKNDVDSN